MTLLQIKNDKINQNVFIFYFEKKTILMMTVCPMFITSNKTIFSFRINKFK